MFFVGYANVYEFELNMFIKKSFSLLKTTFILKFFHHSYSFKNIRKILSQKSRSGITF